MTPAARRLGVAVGALALVAGAFVGSGSLSATGRAVPAPTPQGPCTGPKDRLETDLQGRVPAADYDSGRAARGYACNTVQLSHLGRSGGFKVQRYRDRQGRVCAYFDSTRIFPSDTLMNAVRGQGVYVVAMDDPRNPRLTATLETPAMLSPHESVLVNQRRGLLAAVLGNAYSNAGVLEVYDLQANCRKPRLVSATPTAVLGHESGWSVDGRTFYAASSGAQTFTAIDLSDPAVPVPLFTQYGVNYHGMRLSADGRTLFVAHIGNDIYDGTLPGEGLRILDVSEIQDREPNPQVKILSDLVWPHGSIPQVAEPFTRDGRDYLLQVDEFAKYGPQDPEGAPVGAARIIDIADLKRPKVVSDLRLQVHNPAGRSASWGDPGASSPVGGYAGHYCSVPYRRNPRLVACSMLASGLRIFDISNLRRPVEVAYFNQPSVPGGSENRQGANAFSQPAWDVKGRSVWYSDSNSGFYAVGLTKRVGRLLARR